MFRSTRKTDTPAERPVEGTLRPSEHTTADASASTHARAPLAPATNTPAALKPPAGAKPKCTDGFALRV